MKTLMDSEFFYSYFYFLYIEYIMIVTNYDKIQPKQFTQKYILSVHFLFLTQLLLTLYVN